VAGRVVFQVFGRVSKIPANTLKRPKFAAAVFALNRDGERFLWACPPFCGIEGVFAFERAAKPA